MTHSILLFIQIIISELTDYDLLFFQKVADLANEADEYGCTPLHYASKQGLLKTVMSLIKLGALLNAKNKNRESPLHFAAA